MQLDRMIKRYSSLRDMNRSGKALSFRFNDEERDAIEYVAARLNVKMSDVIRSALIHSGIIRPVCKLERTAKAQH